MMRTWGPSGDAGSGRALERGWQEARMIVEANSVVSSLLAFVAYLLGLSVLVEVLQEFVKFLGGTKAAVYQRVIRDAVGPLWSLVERS